MLNNHCGGSRGSANKLTNLQEQAKPSNNQINTIQSAPLNNGNNHDNISSDNSDVQSLNNTLSGAMDEKQKMLLLKIANNSIAAASAVASAADNDYGNVSVALIPFFPSSTPPLSCQLPRSLFLANFWLLLSRPLNARFFPPEHEASLNSRRAEKFNLRFVYHSIHTHLALHRTLPVPAC